MITVTTNQSWFSRIASSFGGMIIGLLLIPAMIWALSWNEGRAVQTERSLKEGAGAVVTVPSASVSPANEGKLVHTQGTVVIAEPLTDAEFGVTASGVRLIRSAEMYQWVENSKSETRTKLGGGEETVTTYTYAKEWKDSAVDSSSFQQQTGHENPAMTVQGTEISAPSGTMGGFTVGENVLSRMSDAQPVPLGEAQREAITAAVGNSRPVTVSNNQILISANVAPAINPYAPTAPAAPAASTAANIGDQRVTYTVVPAGPISVVGAQTGATFAPYQAKAGDQILLVSRGSETAAAMFKSAQDANVMMTWAIRIGGLLGLMIGFGMLMAPIGVIADFLPFLGSIARLGTGIVGFVLAIVVGFVTIAIAWIAVRPILSVVLITLAVGTFILFGIYGKKKDKARDAAAAETPAPA